MTSGTTYACPLQHFIACFRGNYVEGDCTAADILAIIEALK